MGDDINWPSGMGRGSSVIDCHLSLMNKHLYENILLLNVELDQTRHL